MPGGKKKSNKKEKIEAGLGLVDRWSNLMKTLGEIEGARAEAFARDAPLPGDSISEADSRFLNFNGRHYLNCDL